MTSFTLNDVEQKNAAEKAKEHIKDCPSINFTYTFNPNGGIGVNVTMTCLKCKKEYDITDYNAW